MNNKKRILKYIIVLIVIIILFVPIRFVYQDGGTVEYKAFFYKVVLYHIEFLNKEDMKFEYVEGTQVKILGFEVYNDVNKPEYVY